MRPAENCTCILEDKPKVPKSLGDPWYQECIWKGPSVLCSARTELLMENSCWIGCRNLFFFEESVFWHTPAVDESGNPRPKKKKRLSNSLLFFFFCFLIPQKNRVNIPFGQKWGWGVGPSLSRSTSVSQPGGPAQVSQVWSWSRAELCQAVLKPGESLPHLPTKPRCSRCELTALRQSSIRPGPMAANPVTLRSWDTEGASLKLGEIHLPAEHWVAQESCVLSAAHSALEPICMDWVSPSCLGWVHSAWPSPDIRILLASPCALQPSLPSWITASTSLTDFPFRALPFAPSLLLRV